MGSKMLYTGICVGGPMNGEQGESRFSKGFVLTDVPTGRAWIYDYKHGTGDHDSATLADRPRFVAREQDSLDADKAWSAAQGSDWDVRAYDDKELPEGLKVGL